MLVKITDHKGKPRYLNPAYVKSLNPKGDDTEVEVSGWAMKMRVALPIDEVAAILNAAMPLTLDPAQLAAEDAQQSAAGSAAINAAVFGSIT